MKIGRLNYLWQLFFRDYWLRCPATLLEAVVRRHSPFKIIEGIRVVDPTPQTLDRFTGLVNDALVLLAESDERRFRRIQKEIYCIINAPAVGGYDYGRPFKVCCLDLKCFYDEEDIEMSIRSVASVLVCLATRGHLYSLRILGGKKTKARMAKLCCKEAQRFMNRLGLAKTPWDPECIGPAPRISYSRFILEEVIGRPSNM